MAAYSAIWAGEDVELDERVRRRRCVTRLEISYMNAREGMMMYGNWLWKHVSLLLVMPGRSSGKVVKYKVRSPTKSAELRVGYATRMTLRWSKARSKEGQGLAVGSQAELQ